MDWVIKWATPLTPDLECVPGYEVFLESSQCYSLTANVAGAPGLLFASPDALLQGVQKTINQTSYQTVSQTNYQISSQTNKQAIQKKKRKKSQRKKT